MAFTLEFNFFTKILLLVSVLHSLGFHGDLSILPNYSEHVIDRYSYLVVHTQLHGVFLYSYSLILSSRFPIYIMICVDFEDISYLPFGSLLSQTLMSVTLVHQYCHALPGFLFPVPVHKLPSDGLSYLCLFSKM